MCDGVQLVRRISLPRVTRALVPRFLFEYYCHNARIRVEDGLTQEGFLWEMERHGRWPVEECFYLIRVGDLNGDGAYEYLLSRAAIGQAAFDQEGRILWRYEDEGAVIADIRPDSCFSPIYDLDGDGNAEVVCPRRIDGRLALCLIDGATGTLKAHVPYPRPDLNSHDFGGSISIADLTGSGDARDIVVSWDYNYVAAFNNQLQMLWEREMNPPGGEPKEACSVMGHGHGVRCDDTDGDGRDEVLCGATLIDHDGRVLWSRADLPKINGDHVDGALIADINGDGEKEVFSATGGYLLDARGNVLWGLGKEVVHGQAALAGKLRGDIEGLQIVLHDEQMSRDIARGRKPLVLVLDKNGKELLRLPCGRGEQGPLLGDWNGDGLDELFIPQEDGIAIHDGEGRRVGTIPRSMPGPRLCAPVEMPFVGDLLGDRRVEVLMVGLDDREAWFSIYTNNDENPHAGTRQIPAFRQNSKVLANSCLY